MTQGRSSISADKDRLLAVLEAYGADPARWPTPDQRLTELLASSEPDIEAALKEARAVDRALALTTLPTPPAGAHRRVVAMADKLPGGDASAKLVPIRPARRQPGPDRLSVPSRLTAISALAASLALGLYLGATGLSQGLMPALVTGNETSDGLAELEVIEGTLALFEEQVDL